jgi:uncharacterized Fe-S cluster-containing radical SAM superfamily protein
MVARAIQSRHHLILAHIIPMRRCNLSCAYCDEYDKVSAPVPAAEIFRRIDMLARLGNECYSRLLGRIATGNGRVFTDF